MTRRRYAIATVIATSAFAAAFVAIAITEPLPRLIWNATASAPIGLYRIQPDRDPPTGALVAVTPPDRLAGWLSARGYLPEGVPLLKHVAAKAGQRVCRTGAVVSIDARPVAAAQTRDHRGRLLPVWRGCRRLAANELLLLNPAVPDSLDSRYFGPLPVSAVIGRATPLYLRAPSATPSNLEAKEIDRDDEHL
jgi:conjugative transfer signal peptidase TraF